MTDFLIDNHLLGLAIGLCTFLIIGLFHPAVIKSEYYWGAKRAKWVFLLAGCLGVLAAWWVTNPFWSPLLGVCAFSSFWSIKEVKEQEERVAKGWFPANPNRRK